MVFTLRRSIDGGLWRGDEELSNGFRFSPPTPPGPIREADLWDWYPITTRLKVGRVTGRQLRGILGA